MADKNLVAGVDDNDASRGSQDASEYADRFPVFSVHDGPGKAEADGEGERSAPAAQQDKDSEVSDAVAEQRHFSEVLLSFAAYLGDTRRWVGRLKARLTRLPPRHQGMLPSRFDMLPRLHAAAETNASFLDSVIRPHHQSRDGASLFSMHGRVDAALDANLARVRTTLRQLVREWAEEGAEERSESIDWVVQQVERLLPLQHVNQHAVLVPGAGLARLLFEFARRGYACQGNEFSYHMLMTSEYVLNRISEGEVRTIYPWMHDLNNVLDPEHVLEAVDVPDTPVAGGIPSNVDFSMVAGEFLHVYRRVVDSYDAVACCFFLDTARNICDYLEVIWQMLRPGGYLISVGPLVWHYTDPDDQEASVALSWREMREVLVAIGFTMISEQSRAARYDHHKPCIACYQYQCVAFVARKPVKKEVEEQQQQQQQQQQLQPQ